MGIFDKGKKLLQLKALQNELKVMEFEGVELGGKVRVVVNGEQKVVNIEIAEELLNVNEKEALQRFLKQAITSALTKSQQAVAAKMKGMAGELGL